MNDMNALLNSIKESDRKKAIISLVKHPTAENITILRSIAESDESVELRFLAKKALNYVKSVIKPQVADEKSVRAARINIINLKKYLEGNEKSVSEKIAIIQYLINNNISESLSTLVDYLQIENDPMIISAVVKAVGKFGNEPEIRVLVRYLEHENARVRANTIEALEYIDSPKIYPYIIKKIDDGDNRVKANAIKVVQKLNTIDIIKILKAMLFSSSQSMQESAIFVMGYFPSEENALLLENFIQSSNAAVSEKAVNTLEKYSQKEIKKASEILKKVKKSENIIDEFESALTLFEKRTPIESAVDDLKISLSSYDADLKVNFINNAVNNNLPETGKIILEHLPNEKDVKVIATILINLGRLQYKPAVKHLISALEMKNPRCRANAVESLRLIGDKSSFKHIKPMLEDENNRVKANAIIALKDEPDIDLIKPLAEMVNSKNELMQKSALYSISEIDTPPFRAFLLDLKVSEFKDVASQTLEYIQKLENKGVKLLYDSVPESKSGISAEKESGENQVDSEPLEVNEIISELKKDFASPDINVRINAINKSAAGCHPEVAKILMRQLGKEKDMKVLASLIISIGRMQYKEAQPMLIEYLNIKDNRCRANAIEALTFSGHAGDYMEYVKPLLKDKNNRVKANAIIALKGECEAEINEALKEMIDSNVKLMQKSAVYAIVHSENEKFYHYLLNVAKSTYEDISVYAVNQIKKLESRGLLIEKHKNERSEMISNSIEHDSENKKSEMSVNNESANSADENLILVRKKKDRYYCYVDLKDNIVIEGQYLAAGVFSEGLAPVKIDKKYGYINKSGKLVISPNYNNAFGFSQGMAAVEIDGKFGYIDKYGKLIVNNIFNECGEFAEELSCVKIGKKYDFIDKTGKRLLNSVIDGASKFSEGRARIKIGDKWGFIDKTGQKVIKNQFDDAFDFSDGRACVCLNKKWTYIDRAGKLVIPAKYDFAKSFSQGLAAVEVSGWFNKKWGFIDKTGKLVIPANYDEAGAFSDTGLAYVKMNKKCGYIDKSGCIVIKCQFDDARDFIGNMAYVKSDDNAVMIDTEGNKILELGKWSDYF